MTIVSATVESNGWVLAVRGSWGPTPGAWNFSGFDRFNGQFLSAGVDQFPLDASGTPKVALAVRDTGFDRVDGLPAARTNRPRTIVATKVLRKPAPNREELDEFDHGDGTRTVRLALSDRIFSTSVLEGATILGGWKAGHPGGFAGPVGNLSTRVPVRPISRWAVPPYLLVEGTVGTPNHTAQVDVLIASHYPEHHGIELHQAVAALKLVAYDGTNTKTFWFAGAQTSTVYGDNLRCWGGAIDLSGLNPGMITVHRTVYPWIGAMRETGSSHNTSITGAAGLGHDTPLHIAYDPTGTRYGARKRFVFIDTTSPNVATTNTGTNDAGEVVIQTTIEAARSAAASTKAANLHVAMQAMRIYLDANPGLNLPAANGFGGGTRGADYMEFVLTPGQVHSAGPAMTGSGTSLNGREGLLIVRGDPADSDPKANCIFRSATAATGAQCGRYWLKDMTVELGQASIWSNPGQFILLDNVHVTGKPGYTTGSTSSFFATGSSLAMVQCSGANYDNQLGGQLMRNCTRTGYVPTGATFIGVTINTQAGSNRSLPAFYTAGNQTDYMIWGCKVFQWDGAIWNGQTGADNPAATGASWNPQITRRVAMVNTLIEGVGSALLQYGELNNQTFRECLLEGNTIVGARMNFHNEPPQPLTSSGTTVTAAIENHGLIVGDTVIIAGCTPAAYNGTFPVTAVLDVHRFRFVAASAPGGSVTVRGTITLPGPVVRPIVRENAFNIDNCLRNNAVDDNGTKQDAWTNDGGLTGAWEVLYGVSYRSNFKGNRDNTGAADFQHAFYGVGSDVDVSYVANGTNWHGFVADHTNRGPLFPNGIWNGDYRPAAGSRLLGGARTASIDRTADGAERGTSFPVGALAASAAEPAAGQLDVRDAGHVTSSTTGRLDWAGRVAGANAAHATIGSPARLVTTTEPAEPGTRLRVLIVEAEGRGVSAAGD